MPKPIVDYKVSSGQPVEVLLRASDGVQYKCLAQFTVLAVVEKDDRDKDGNLQFDIQFGIMAKSERVAT